MNTGHNMRFCSLGSGSNGNAHIVQKGKTTLLIECGFSPSMLRQRLLMRRLLPFNITASFISHEHSDHIKGLSVLQQYNIPFYMSAGTARALKNPNSWRCITADETVQIEGLTVHPMSVPHDVNEPLQFIIDDGIHKLGIFTDLGFVPHNIRQFCYKADALVLECNYDEKMLWDGNYPQHIKQRIASNVGHLSNTAAAALVAETKGATSGKRRHIIAAHLSENNNDSTIVERLLRTADPNAHIHIIDQRDGTDWINI